MLRQTKDTARVRVYGHYKNTESKIPRCSSKNAKNMTKPLTRQPYFFAFVLCASSGFLLLYFLLARILFFLVSFVCLARRRAFLLAFFCPPISLAFSCLASLLPLCFLLPALLLPSVSLLPALLLPLSFHQSASYLP